jgi:hypothetical protein
MRTDKGNEGPTNENVVQRRTWPKLRRSFALVAFVVAAIALMLVESIVIEHAPVPFAGQSERSAVERGPEPIAALASDAMPVAVLH